MKPKREKLDGWTEVKERWVQGAISKPSPSVVRWLKEQYAYHVFWARSGPSGNGFWAANPTQQRKDFETIRDWLREIVKGME